MGRYADAVRKAEILSMLPKFVRIKKTVYQLQIGYGRTVSRICAGYQYGNRWLFRYEGLPGQLLEVLENTLDELRSFGTFKPVNDNE